MSDLLYLNRCQCVKVLYHSVNTPNFSDSPIIFLKDIFPCTLYTSPHFCFPYIFTCNLWHTSIVCVDNKFSLRSKICSLKIQTKDLFVMVIVIVYLMWSTIYNIISYIIIIHDYHSHIIHICFVESSVINFFGSSHDH